MDELEKRDSLINELSETITKLCGVFENFLGDIGHSQNTYQRDEIEKARNILSKLQD